MALADTLFGDETGTGGDSPFVVVAGYIGSPRQWELFDAQWRKALDSEGVPSFHAKRFFPRSARNKDKDSPFHGWEDSRLNALLDRLLTAIDDRRILPVGFGMNVAEFNAQPLAIRKFMTSGTLNYRYRVGRGREPELHTRILGTGAPTRPPYMASFTGMLLDALIHSRPRATVNVVMDENKDNEALARLVVERIRSNGWPSPNGARLGDLTYSYDERYPGLQAADMYCYLWNSVLSGRRATPLIWHAWAALNRKRSGLFLFHGDMFEKVRNNQNFYFARWMSGVLQQVRS